MTTTKSEEKDVALEALLEGLKLSENEASFIASNAAFLSSAWDETKKAIALRFFRPIIAAQLDKAISGDTTSAKFMLEFAAPPDLIEGPTILPRWEQIAIEIRDEMQVELSAENLVFSILEAFRSLKPAAKAKFLGVQVETNKISS